ncbi:MAG: 3-deoxy-manno-octulosonate cytidylyltransferase [Chitinophagales bacterium]|nr:3-deoxy-manno-octulosonate cytidylyltransferase [Chitinophagales bacterium]
MRILAIIPARYSSVRFPGKPLADINGKPMVQRVYEQVKKCSSIKDIVVATDDERIINAVNSIGGKAVLTLPDHQSGTDRCAEVIQRHKENFDVIINVQGDEPFIAPDQIELIASCFKNQEIQIATLIKRITQSPELFDSSKVKVVINEKEEAMYFSRFPIPFLRGVSEELWLENSVYYKHIGIYGYRTEVLSQIVKLPVHLLEKAESLEQLRWLANGYRIQTALTELESISVDTIEDLNAARKFLNEGTDLHS